MSVIRVIRTKPELWEKVKKTVLHSPKGGASGKWSARKAQLAVSIYKKKGGGYKGKKSPSNSLVRWTRENWGYIDDIDDIKSKKKSAKKSRRKSIKKSKGRYLPKKVREQLTSSEKKRENLLKGAKRGKWIPYSESVRQKMTSYLKKSRRRPKHLTQ